VKIQRITLPYRAVSACYRATLVPSPSSGATNEITAANVSPLCQRVSPFQTLHALYLLALCQRVSLFLKKVDNWSNILDWFSLMLKV
jgi:hypothetical protein